MGDIVSCEAHKTGLIYKLIYPPFFESGYIFFAMSPIKNEK